jgi:8-oxo-dGTP diphosphatase
MPKRWKLEFAATPRRFVRCVRRFRKVNWTGPCYLYTLNPENLVIYRKHRVGELHDADIPFIVNYWPHGRSEPYLLGRIHAGPTCAIRVKGKLAAWALTHADGAMGILHVLDEYRGQGMARSITTALARRILKRGLKPFLYIVRKNVASTTLTESMGFKRYGEYCWFGQ